MPHYTSSTLRDTIVEEGAALAALADPPVRKSIIVIGGGQAGLSVGYHLKRLGIDDFLILDAGKRIGDAWRQRWDSLKLFTPNAYNGLNGMPFPGPGTANATKDQMADYLEAYAERFALPVMLRTRVESLARDAGRFVITTEDGRRFVADQVVVAMSNYQSIRRPAYAGEISPSIRQFDIETYRNPGQLQAGDVLIVGGGNSGAEIARDLAATHRVVMAGPKINEVPGVYGSFFSRHVMNHILNRVVFPKIMSVNTPMGRKARANIMKNPVPLIRVKSRDLDALGVTRVGRVTGTRDGVPLLEDGRTVSVSNVVWCNGFGAGLEWIKLPVLLPNGEPDHERGLANAVPGLFFLGQHFLTAMSSSMVHGVGTDAKRIAALMAAKVSRAA